MVKFEIVGLIPMYSSCKSFYGKARVRIDDDDTICIKQLISYTTVVASYTKDKKTGFETYKCEGKFSCTTTRHQKEFFKQLGLSDKEIEILFKEGELNLC